MFAPELTDKVTGGRKAGLESNGFNGVAAELQQMLSRHQTIMSKVLMRRTADLPPEDTDQVGC